MSLVESTGRRTVWALLCLSGAAVLAASTLHAAEEAGPLTVDGILAAGYHSSLTGDTDGEEFDGGGVPLQLILGYRVSERADLNLKFAYARLDGGNGGHRFERRRGALPAIRTRVSRAPDRRRAVRPGRRIGPRNSRAACGQTSGENRSSDRPGDSRKASSRASFSWMWLTNRLRSAIRRGVPDSTLAVWMSSMS